MLRPRYNMFIIIIKGIILIVIQRENFLQSNSKPGVQPYFAVIFLLGRSLGLPTEKTLVIYVLLRD